MTPHSTRRSSSAGSPARRVPRRSPRGILDRRPRGVRGSRLRVARQRPTSSRNVPRSCRPLASECERSDRVRRCERCRMLRACCRAWLRVVLGVYGSWLLPVCLSLRSTRRAPRGHVVGLAVAPLAGRSKVDPADQVLSTNARRPTADVDDWRERGIALDPAPESRPVAAQLVARFRDGHQHADHCDRGSPPRHTPPNVGKVVGKQGQKPRISWDLRVFGLVFQAGYAGSIPVTRSMQSTAVSGPCRRLLAPTSSRKRSLPLRR